MTRRTLTHRLFERFRNRIGIPIFLHVRPDRLSACRYSNRRITTLAEFSATPEGQARFADFLVEQRAADFILFADTDDEITASAVIPRVFGRDRKTLIRRKLEADLPEMTFRACASLGKLSENHQQEKLLLWALNRKNSLAPWLAKLASTESSVAGLYSPGQLDEQVLSAIPANRALALLVICNDRSIRQTLLINGRRHFSRAMPFPSAGSTADQSFLINEEANRLLQYLAAQGIVAPGDTPEKTFIAPPDIATALSALLNSEGDHAAPAKALDRSCIAAACGLDPATPWEQTGLALLARRRPKQQLAPREMLETYRDRRLSSILLTLSIGILLAGCTFAVWAWQQAASQLEQAYSHQRQAAELQARYAKIARTFPQPEMEHQTLRRLSEDYRSIVSQRHAMETLLNPLSQALTETRNIQLNRITWLAADPETPGLLIEGTLTITAGGYRQGDDEFNGLVASLNKHSGLASTVIASPFQFTSDQNFRNDRDEPSSSAFKLRLDQRPRS